MKKMTLDERNEKMRNILQQFGCIVANNSIKAEEMNRKLYEIQKEYYEQES